MVNFTNQFNYFSPLSQFISIVLEFALKFFTCRKSMMHIQDSHILQNFSVSLSHFHFNATITIVKLRSPYCIFIHTCALLTHSSSSEYKYHFRHQIALMRPPLPILPITRQTHWTTDDPLSQRLPLPPQETKVAKQQKLRFLRRTRKTGKQLLSQQPQLYHTSTPPKLPLTFTSEKLNFSTKVI